MAMPELDPERYVHLVLGDPSHRMPIPGTQMLFPAEGRVVDIHDPFWRALLADRSLRRARPDEIAAPPATRAVWPASSEEPAGA